MGNQQRQWGVQVRICRADGKDAVMKDVRSTVAYINNDEPFERCYEPIPETYRGKSQATWSYLKSVTSANINMIVGINIQELPLKYLKLKNHL